MSFEKNFGKPSEIKSEEISSERGDLKTPKKLNPKIKEKQLEKAMESKERWKKLDRNLGISFQKGENFKDLKSHLELIKKNNLREVQFHLRKGVNFEEIQPLLQKLKEDCPETNLSFHLDSPSFSESGEMINREELERQIEFSHECGVNLVTLHQVDIKMENYIKLSGEEKQKIVEGSAQFLAESIFQTIEQRNPLAFAVENVGQTPDEMDTFLQLIQSKLGEILEKSGIGVSGAQEMATLFTREKLGLTLDVNHALHPGKKESEREALSRLAELTGKSEEEIVRFWNKKEEILKGLSEENRSKVINIEEEMKQTIETKRRPTLEEWFNKFGDKIKCVHIFTPTIEREKDKKDFQNKLTDIMDLYNEHGLDVPVYLETKKDSETTQTAFYLTREKIKEKTSSGFNEENK